MLSVRHPPPVVKPVSVAAYFVGGISHVELMEGSAVLSITDRLTKMEKLYWCGLLHDGGIIRGFSLTTLESCEVYLLSRELGRCDCPDHLYRPRSGGCRHRAALRQAFSGGRHDPSTAA
jgi:hypothetical protein